MDYYNEIKNELINNEAYKKVKDYSINKSDLNTYYNVGKILSKAGKHYGEGIITEYSKRLTIELGKGYSKRNLWLMLKFYQMNEKVQTLSAQLSWSHYCELLTLESIDKINYYTMIIEKQNLSVRELRIKIKNKEYERLDEETKNKLIEKTEESSVHDFIKHPIIIKNKCDYEEISEKILKQLILEDIQGFMQELGQGFSFIGSEYKITIGPQYNYIDLLLYNYIYHCFIVVELKVTELKAEYIGQIKKYMNYIDKNIKNINQEKTIGIIICKKDNKFIMEYCSDSRIYRTTYELVNI